MMVDISVPKSEVLFYGSISIFWTDMLLMSAPFHGALFLLVRSNRLGLNTFISYCVRLRNLIW